MSNQMYCWWCVLLGLLLFMLDFPLRLNLLRLNYIEHVLQEVSLWFIRALREELLVYELGGCTLHVTTTQGLQSQTSIRLGKHSAIISYWHSTTDTNTIPQNWHYATVHTQATNIWQHYTAMHNGATREEVAWPVSAKIRKTRTFCKWKHMVNVKRKASQNPPADTHPRSTLFSPRC